MQKLAFIGISLCGMLLSACGQDNRKTDTTAGHKIPVITVSQKDIQLDRLYVSDIQAVQNVEIRSRIPGFLEHIYVDEGQLVRKGQLLFRINDQEYRAEVEKAAAKRNSILAEARTVELEVERVRALVGKKIISPTELELAKAKLNAIRAQVDEAEAALSHARTRLSYTQVRAPYDGVLNRIPLKTGSLLDEGTLITSVSDISSVFVYFNISENEYLDYLRGQDKQEEQPRSVRLILSDGEEYALPGKVETVVSEFDETTGSIAFRARFPNPDHLLKHGATGKIRLSQQVNALVLPQKAVFEIQDKNYVYVLGRDNKVHMRSFAPKARLDEYYIVGSGLEAGEKVVYEGIQNIRDGMQIAPVVVRADSLGRKSIL